MKVSIVIVNYNTKQLLIDCLNSVSENKWHNDYQIIVVDNGSTDDSVDQVKKLFSKVAVIKNETNQGFGVANNLGIKRADTDWVLLLNSDTAVLPGSLDKLVEVAQKENFSICSGKLLNKDGSLQPNAGDLPLGWALVNWLSSSDSLFKVPSFHRMEADFYIGTKQVGWVSGAVMLLNKSLLKSVGWFDQRLFMYAEDVDLCWRAKDMGLKVGWTDLSEVVHLGGGSSSNPHYVQWLGEFKGVVYLYHKHFGGAWSLSVKMLIELFVLFRMMAFLLTGKGGVAKTYGQILFNL